jgi:hypothetical protein
MQIRILRTNRFKIGSASVGSAVAAFVGIWLVTTGDSIGWGLAIFFGLLAIVFGATALPNSSYLELRPDGFKVCTLFRPSTYLWSEVGPFTVGTIGLNPMVVFNFSSDYRGLARSRKVAAGLTGHEGALPDSYGLPLPELAQVLNEYRNAYFAA